MAVMLKPLLAEFATYLDRTGLDRRLQLLHQVMVGAGLLGCLIVLGIHFGLAPSGEHAPFFARNLMLTLSMINLAACTVIIGRAQDSALRRLQAPSETVDQRANQVAMHIVHRDRLLLAMAVVGQLLVALSAHLHIGLLSIDAPLVVLNLLPTAQLAVIGWHEVPTRSRLLFLYKLVALHNERSRARAERLAAQEEDQLAGHP